MVGGLAVFAGPAAALSLLHYNVAGNGTTNWGTNSWQVQAIGRQMLYWQPEVAAFNEIPRTNTWQMANFVQAYLPGYFLATNAGTDGFIRSTIASRYPIVRSQSWLDGADLRPFGYTNSPFTFTRDLFEAEIAVPGWGEHLHVFTTHLKAYGGSGDTTSALRRAAEASAISNFLVTVFLPAHGRRPYVLTGDFNEDVADPPPNSGHPVERLVSPPTGLRLTTPRNPTTGSSNTYSIRATSNPADRIDYILPCGLLFSNLASGQVFRTDRLTPLPAGLLAIDSRTASDHLPLVMSFHDPYDTNFRITSILAGPESVQLVWPTTTGRTYRVERTRDAQDWSIDSPNLMAATTNLSWIADRMPSATLFRVLRLP